MGGSHVYYVACITRSLSKCVFELCQSWSKNRQKWTNGRGIRWEPLSRPFPASDGALGQCPHFIQHTGFSLGLKLKDRPSGLFVCFLILVSQRDTCVFTGAFFSVWRQSVCSPRHPMKLGSCLSGLHGSSSRSHEKRPHILFTGSHS